MRLQRKTIYITRLNHNSFPNHTRVATFEILFKKALSAGIGTHQPYLWYIREGRTIGLKCRARPDRYLATLKCADNLNWDWAELRSLTLYIMTNFGEILNSKEIFKGLFGYIQRFHSVPQYKWQLPFRFEKRGEGHFHNRNDRKTERSFVRQTDFNGV